MIRGGFLNPLFHGKINNILVPIVMGDDELLDELAERIAEGPIIFTPDEEWVDLLNDEQDLD